MRYKTTIQLEAVQDFEAAKQWYKKTGVNGLSQLFSSTVKLTITNLQKHPNAYAIRHKNIRIAHTGKFPYAIHFFIDNDYIIITAIIYSGRDPALTFERV